MDFIIIANPWQDGVRNPTSKHHIAIELVRRGHRVLWVNGTGMRKPSVGSGADRGRILRKIGDAFVGVERQETGDKRQEIKGGLWTVAPLILPLPANNLARRINEWIYLTVMRVACRKLGLKDAVLINFLPILPGVLKGWNGKSVYYCVDKWSAFDNYDTELMKGLDAECCKNADAVIASARDLEQNCLKHNENTYLVLHGVDYSHFAANVAGSRLQVARPSDLPKGRVVGFFGLLSAWVDQELLIKLARELNQRTDDRGQTTDKSSTTNDQQLVANIILIGKADVDVSCLAAEDNIYLLGQKSYSELPEYLEHFDVGLIPFVVNNLTKAVNPIKLREMLAGGCRVVATALPEVELLAQQVAGSRLQVAGGVSVAEDNDQFVAMVADILNQPWGEDDRQRLSESMASETWEAKVGRILERIQLIVKS